jgi:hypothetical protein
MPCDSVSGRPHEISFGAKKATPFFPGKLGRRTCFQRLAAGATQLQACVRGQRRVTAAASMWYLLSKHETWNYWHDIRDSRTDSCFSINRVRPNRHEEDDEGIVVHSFSSFFVVVVGSEVYSELLRGGGNGDLCYLPQRAPAHLPGKFPPHHRPSQSKKISTRLR